MAKSWQAFVISKVREFLKIELKREIIFDKHTKMRCPPL
jgi:hypothetical protein